MSEEETKFEPEAHREEVKLPASPPPVKGKPRDSDSESAPSIHNPHDTIKIWKKRAKQIAFVHEFILDKYRKRVEFVSLLTFLLASAASLLALGNFGLPSGDYPNLSLSIKAVNAVLSTGAAAASGISKIGGWNGTIKDCEKYLDIVENFITNISSEQTLPLHMRLDEQQFIMLEKSKFQIIINSAPDISHNDQVEALSYYKASKSKREFISV